MGSGKIKLPLPYSIADPFDNGLVLVLRLCVIIKDAVNLMKFCIFIALKLLLGLFHVI